MTENKRFERIYADVDVFCRDHNAKGISQLIEKEDYDKIVDLLNALHEENEQLKQNKFICLDCEHSGYTEIGCLCEKKDHWTEYKTECEDYEELK